MSVTSEEISTTTNRGGATTAPQTASPSTPSTTPASSLPASGILMGLNVSLLECLFVLMEFIFGTVIFPAIWRIVLQYPCRKLYDQVTCDEIYRILGYFSIAYWLVNRLSWTGFTNMVGIKSLLQFTFNPFLGLKTFFTTAPNESQSNTGQGSTNSAVSESNKNPQTPSKGARIFVYFVIAHVISIAIMLTLQFTTSTQLYTLDNFYVVESSQAAAPNVDVILGEKIQNTIPIAVTSDPLSETVPGEDVTPTTIPSSSTPINTNPVPEKDQPQSETPVKKFSPLHVLFLMFLAPLFEEIIFRCVMLTFVHLRLTKYFPGRFELTEKMNKTRSILQSSDKAKGKKVIVRKKVTDKGKDDQDQVDSGAENTVSIDNQSLQPRDSRYKSPPFNIAQYASVLSGLAFGLIHFINLLNGYSLSYVILQAIVGTLIGIILNVAAYNHGHFVALAIHVINNIIASFVSQDIDVTSSKIFMFGFAETIICYLVLAYFSLESLSNKEPENVPAVLLSKLPLPFPDTYPQADKDKAAAAPNTTPIEFHIPRHYHAFNNHIVRSLAQQNELPVSAKTDNSN